MVRLDQPDRTKMDGVEVVTYPEHETGKTCFVAMPVTTPSFYAEKLNDHEHFPHILTHLFVPALEEVGLTVIPPLVRGAELIHAEIIKNLEQADLVLCDLSSLNPNVFFELGIRTSLDRPVAIVKDNFTMQIPFDLNAVNTLTYDGSLTPWTLAAEVSRLAEHVKSIINNDSTGNSMWRYFGLTKRATPSEAGDHPVEAKLDLLISEFAKLQIPHSNAAIRSEISGFYDDSLEDLVNRLHSSSHLNISELSVDSTNRSLSLIVHNPEIGKRMLREDFKEISRRYRVKIHVRGEPINDETFGS